MGTRYEKEVGPRPVYTAREDHCLSRYLAFCGTTALALTIALTPMSSPASVVVGVGLVFFSKELGRILSRGEDYIGYIIDVALWNRRLKKSGRSLWKRQMNGGISIPELQKRIRKKYGSDAFLVENRMDSLALTVPGDPVPQISIVPLAGGQYSVIVELYHCRLEDRIIPFDIAVDQEVTWEQLSEILGQYVRKKIRY